MVKIVADDELVKSKLLDLINLTTENGAFFHSDITVVAEKGDLRLESMLENTNRTPIIHIPESCLPKLDDFDVSIEDGRFFFKSRANHTDKLQYEIFSLIIELFNYSNKIELHAQTFPWFVFRNYKDIVEHLSRGRSGSESFYKLFTSGDMKQLMIDSYLGARHLYYSATTAGKTNAVLLPIIDCVNHHTAAIPFVTGTPSSEAKTGLMLRNSKPNENSDECFARYNKADMLSAYLCYGFVDMSAIVLRSIPVTIKIPKVGTIEVFAYSYHRNAMKIPPEFDDIQYFFPDIKRVSKTRIEVSHLMIPPDSSPNSLRRILEFLIRLMRPHILKSKLKKLVLRCESQVLNDNTKYYKRLDNLANTYPLDGVSEDSLNMLNQLIAGQCNKLSAYKKLMRH